MRHTLVLGGARSGKTAFAERLALRSGSRPLYLATTETMDDEMRERVQSHRARRTGQFDLREEPLQLSRAILESSQNDVILVDCLTLWINNMLMTGEDVATAVSELCATLMEYKSSKLVLVSTEVGLGISPEDSMTRTFRDLTGSAHQRLAEICDDVYFVAAGLPLTLKGETPFEN